MLIMAKHGGFCCIFECIRIVVSVSGEICHTVNRTWCQEHDRARSTRRSGKVERGRYGEELEAEPELSREGPTRTNRLIHCLV